MTLHTLQSPLPGVFYRRPGPTQPVYDEVGAVVTADQTVGLVEVMKQFIEIKAGVAGTLVSFVVEVNAMLGPGDPIAMIETA